MNIETAQRLREAGTSLGNASRAGTGSGDALGKQDFMNLLMTQITHQDPINPMDSSGMMNQLAQMGTLEQLTNVNTALARLEQKQAEQSRASSQFYLGRDVTIEGSQLNLLNGETNAPIRFQLSEQSNQTAINIYDTQGDLVRRMELGGYHEGLHQIPWDGTDDQGQTLADGTYRFEATALNRLEAPMQVKTFVQGRVSGLRFTEGENYLMVDGKPWRSQDIMELSTRSQQRYGTLNPLPLQQQAIPLPLKERE